MTPIFIYDLLIGGINVSDFHIVVFFNDYYTLIVAFLTKQIQNRYRYRRVATPRFIYIETHPLVHNESVQSTVDHKFRFILRASI